MAGRIKIPRNISLDISSLINKHMGPIGYTKTQLKSLPVTILYPDEVQALAWRDVEGLNMLDAAAKMGISKTVYAGIYTSARTKISTAFIRGEIIQIEEEIPNIATPASIPKPGTSKKPQEQAKKNKEEEKKSKKLKSKKKDKKKKKSKKSKKKKK